MPIELGSGMTVQVELPEPPAVLATPPSASVAVVPISGPAGPQGPPGASSSSGQVVLTATASAALSGHRVVTRQADGQLIYASNTVANHIHAPLWITSGAVDAGAPVEVVAYGVMTEPSWSWTPGGALYLGVNGAITQTPPGSPAVFTAQLGVATGPTEVFIDRQPSILLV